MFSRNRPFIIMNEFWPDSYHSRQLTISSQGYIDIPVLQGSRLPFNWVEYIFYQTGALFIYWSLSDMMVPLGSWWLERKKNISPPTYYLGLCSLSEARNIECLIPLSTVGAWVQVQVRFLWTVDGFSGVLDQIYSWDFVTFKRFTGIYWCHTWTTVNGSEPGLNFELIDTIDMDSRCMQVYPFSLIVLIRPT